MEKGIEEHTGEYGTAPEVTAVSPARVHLIGEHTCFFKDKTLSMAVNFPVYVSVSKRDDATLKFYFVQLKDRKKATVSALKLKKEDRWANAIKAVVYGFQNLGYEVPGISFTVYSDILPSAGVGITTAIKVAAAWAIKRLCGFACSEAKLLSVLECANRKFLAQDNFLADNFTAIYSKKDSVVLTDYSRGTYDVIPFKWEKKTIVLTDLGVPRVTTWNEESLQQPENVLLLGELKEPRTKVYGGWHYADSGSEAMEVLSVVSEDVRRRLMCIMAEHQCVLDAENAIRKADFSSFARAVNKSYENLRDLYDLSCPEIDWVIKRVLTLEEKPSDLRILSNCGRITGKGFGRCIYAIIRNEDVEKYKARLNEYERIFGFKAEFRIIKPATGVHFV